MSTATATKIAELEQWHALWESGVNPDPSGPNVADTDGIAFPSKLYGPSAYGMHDTDTLYDDVVVAFRGNGNDGGVTFYSYDIYERSTGRRVFKGSRNTRFFAKRAARADLKRYRRNPWNGV